VDIIYKDKLLYLIRKLFILFILYYISLIRNIIYNPDLNKVEFLLYLN